MSTTELAPTSTWAVPTAWFPIQGAVAALRRETLMPPLRPVWLSDLLAELTTMQPRHVGDPRNVVLRAVRMMAEAGDIRAVVKDSTGQWCAGPTNADALVQHIEEQWRRLGRDPVRGEVCVVRGSLRGIRGALPG
jgi:hypothetical protein